MYNQKNYQEDLKLCRAVLKKFSNEKKQYQDLEQIALLAIYKGRKCFNSQKASLSTYLYSCAYTDILYYLKRQSKDVSNYCCLLSEPIAEDLTIEDTLGEEMQINELGLDRVFKAIIHKVKRKLGDKSNSYLKFIKCKLNFMSNKEIEERLCCTRQFVSKLNKQLRADIVSYSKKFGIEKEINYYANN